MTLASISDMNLHKLFKGLGAEAPSLDVADITLDSRTAVRHGLFIACRGTREHGLDHVGDALRAGVDAVAWESGESRPAPALPAGVASLAVPRLREQLGEVDLLRTRVAELEERIEFTERLLAQRKDQDLLPRGGSS